MQADAVAPAARPAAAPVDPHAAARARGRAVPIVPRRMDFDFSGVPRFWFGGDPVPTHIINSVSLLFPAGERFFVRSVRKFIDRIDDPALKAQARAFSQQEGSHAREHERHFEWLRAQGYPIDDFLRVYERFCYDFVEKVVPDSVNLAGTAAGEHFTALLAERLLSDEFIGSADPVMQQLLSWHACEEIEHKSVAWDVLQAVDARYSVRVAGLAMSTVLLTGWWIAGAVMLFRHDGITRAQVRARAREIGKERPLLHKVFARGIREFLDRDFHPWNNDNAHLAHAYLERVGRLTS